MRIQNVDRGYDMRIQNVDGNKIRLIMFCRQQGMQKVWQQTKTIYCTKMVKAKEVKKLQQKRQQHVKQVRREGYQREQEKHEHVIYYIYNTILDVKLIFLIG